MAVSKRTRFEVFKRDRFTCRYCGRTPPAVKLEVDHIIPKSRGGSDKKSNLGTACFDCNSGKSNVPLASETDELRVVDEQIRRLDRCWHVQLIDWRGGYSFSQERADLFRWLLGQMPESYISEAIRQTGEYFQRAAVYCEDSAMGYFCRACWGMIYEAEGAA